MIASSTWTDALRCKRRKIQEAEGEQGTTQSDIELGLQQRYHRPNLVSSYGTFAGMSEFEQRKAAGHNQTQLESLKGAGASEVERRLAAVEDYQTQLEDMKGDGTSEVETQLESLKDAGTLELERRLAAVEDYQTQLASLKDAGTSEVERRLAAVEAFQTRLANLKDAGTSEVERRLAAVEDYQTQLKQLKDAGMPEVERRLAAAEDYQTQLERKLEDQRSNLAEQRDHVNGTLAAQQGQLQQFEREVVREIHAKVDRRFVAFAGFSGDKCGLNTKFYIDCRQMRGGRPTYWTADNTFVLRYRGGDYPWAIQTRDMLDSPEYRSLARCSSQSYEDPNVWHVWVNSAFELREAVRATACFLRVGR